LTFSHISLKNGVTLANFGPPFKTCKLSIFLNFMNEIHLFFIKNKTIKVSFYNISDRSNGGQQIVQKKVNFEGKPSNF